MSSQPVRVRFAPSPTGFLHIGGVRTALFCWLYARRFKGQFLLRIEDTDLDRSEDRYTQDILSSLQWLGLRWDEGPIYQSQRLPVYRKKALELISQGHAYWCDCSEADLEQIRELAIKEGRRPQYDRRCRNRGLSERKTSEKPAVIRLKIPTALADGDAGFVEFNDLIRGPIRVENTEIDDFVLIRSNGAPTYNLSVVVDDVHSRMTHVIRGDDHINNTPKQIHLYRYLKYPEPYFAHLPMILGPDKKKLSKRHGAVSANVYREEGFLPEAMLNFLARLGWSHGDQEVFTLEEMVSFFDFNHVQKASGVFNSEKLSWLAGEHMRKADPERLRSILCEDFAALFNPAQWREVQSPLGLDLVRLIQPKVRLVKEIADQLLPLVTEGDLAVDTSALKWQKDATLKSNSKAAVSELLAQLSSRAANHLTLAQAGVSPTEIDALLRQIGEKNGVKLGDLVQPIRLTVSGRMVSPSVFDLLVTLPWERVKSRLDQVLTLDEDQGTGLRSSH